MDGTLTIELIERFRQELHDKGNLLAINPDIIVVSPRIEYRLRSRIIHALPGATRWRGPDGKEWIEAKWQTAQESYGSGNKAKRRQGLVPKAVWCDEVLWVKKEDA